ncbi:hypothetical protein BGX20_004247, partial [Mortierella sp. AD010]
LKLRTILSLIPDPPDAIFQEFCTQQGIKSIHLPVDKVKDNVPLTYNRAVEAVQIIIDQENLPIYIHCLDGASVTGLVVCCLRKLQTWNISSAMGEFLRYLRGGVISSEESVFVEKFCSEIEISKPIPLWLWEGQITFKKHPTLKLKFTIPPTPATPSVINTSIPSPTLPNQNVAAVFPSHQGDGSGATRNSTGAAINGGDASTHGVNGDSSAISNLSNNNQSGLGSSLLSPSMALQNHASRLLTKGSSSRDRPNRNKTSVRTDVSGLSSSGPRATSITTPTTAALPHNKTFMAGNSSILGQQHQLSSQDQAPSDSTALAAETATALKSSSQSSLSSSGPSNSSGRAASEASETARAPHIINIVRGRRGSLSAQSGEHGLESGDNANTGKDGGSNVGPGLEESNADSSTSAAQDRNVSGPAIAKNVSAAAPTPAPAAEVADEYYEVSMTLKALALEGADF